MRLRTILVLEIRNIGLASKSRASRSWEERQSLGYGEMLMSLPGWMWCSEQYAAVCSIHPRKMNPDQSRGLSIEVKGAEHGQKDDEEFHHPSVHMRGPHMRRMQ